MYAITNRNRKTGLLSVHVTKNNNKSMFQLCSRPELSGNRNVRHIRCQCLCGKGQGLCHERMAGRIKHCIRYVFLRSSLREWRPWLNFYFFYLKNKTKLSLHAVEVVKLPSPVQYLNCIVALTATQYKTEIIARNRLIPPLYPRPHPPPASNHITTQHLSLSLSVCLSLYVNTLCLCGNSHVERFTHSFMPIIMYINNACSLISTHQ